MFEAIALTLAAMGFWFWTVCGLVFVAILFFEEHENNIGAFIVFGLFVGLMEWSGALSIFTDPLTMLMYLAGYYAAGVVWSFIKWLSFLQKRADKFAELKLAWIVEHNTAMQNEIDRGVAAEEGEIALELLPVDAKLTLTSDQKKDLKRYLADNLFIGWHNASETVIPTARENKNKIVTWILWWPCSALWTLLNDPLVRLANYLYTRLQGMYARLANMVFSKYNVEEL